MESSIADPCDVCGKEAHGDGTCSPCRAACAESRFETIRLTIPGNRQEGLAEGAWRSVASHASDLGNVTTGREGDERRNGSELHERALLAALRLARDLDLLMESDHLGRVQREQDGEIEAPWIVLMTAIEYAIERERDVIHAESSAEPRGRLEVETITCCAGELEYLIGLHDQLEAHDDPHERRTVRLSDVSYTIWQTLAPSTVEAVNAMVEDAGVVMTSDYIVIRHYATDRIAKRATPDAIQCAEEIEAAEAIRRDRVPA